MSKRTISDGSSTSEDNKRRRDEERVGDDWEKESDEKDCPSNKTESHESKENVEEGAMNVQGSANVLDHSRSSPSPNDAESIEEERDLLEDRESTNDSNNQACSSRDLQPDLLHREPTSNAHEEGLPVGNQPPVNNPPSRSPSFPSSPSTPRYEPPSPDFNRVPLNRQHNRSPLHNPENRYGRFRDWTPPGYNPGSPIDEQESPQSPYTPPSYGTPETPRSPRYDNPLSPGYNNVSAWSPSNGYPASSRNEQPASPRWEPTSPTDDPARFDSPEQHPSSSRQNGSLSFSPQFGEPSRYMNTARPSNQNGYAQERFSRNSTSHSRPIHGSSSGSLPSTSQHLGESSSSSESSRHMNTSMSSNRNGYTEEPIRFSRNSTSHSIPVHGSSSDSMPSTSQHLVDSSSSSESSRHMNTVMPSNQNGYAQEPIRFSRNSTSHSRPIHGSSSDSMPSTSQRVGEASSSSESRPFPPTISSNGRVIDNRERNEPTMDVTSRLLAMSSRTPDRESSSQNMPSTSQQFRGSPLPPEPRPSDMSPNFDREDIDNGEDRLSGDEVYYHDNDEESDSSADEENIENGDNEDDASGAEEDDSSDSGEEGDMSGDERSDQSGDEGNIYVV